jgi:Glycosyl transferase family 2
MTLPPALSVIMSVHNNAHFLDAAIQSILDQSFTDFEFLIVDDGSSDGSAAIMDEHARTDARIRVIRQSQKGLIASLNLLLSSARAPLVARMDGDDIALPERFARQLAWIRDNPGHGAVGTWAVTIDQNGQRGKDAPRSGASHEGLTANMAWGPILLHPTVVMDRAIVQGLGGYRPAYRYCEDYDLWLRLSQVSQLANVPECLFEYRRHVGQVTHIHLVEQLTNAAIAWEAHRERIAGRPDPTITLEKLPELDRLDQLFGRAGVAAAVAKRVVPELLHSRIALRHDGFGLILDFVREGGDRSGLWRTVARLMAMAEPVRALRLARLLLAR